MTTAGDTAQIEAWNALQRYLVAVYFTVVTMSATGFGDIFPLENFGFLTVIVTVVVGFIVFSYTLSVLAATLANHDAPKYECCRALHFISSVPFCT